METVFQYRIPVWHPIAVHFPPVLLLLSVVVAGGWIWQGGARWQFALLGMLALSTLGTAFAYFTGEAMRDRARGAPMVEELVGLHEQLALYTLIGVGVSLGVAGAVAVWARQNGSTERVPRWMRLLVGLCVATAAALVAFTAHIGGIMTWGAPI